MAKVTLSRLFEVSRYLTTEAGDQLKDALFYLSEFVEVTTRNLRNGLTFTDNFDTIIKTISVRPDTETVILVSDKRRATEVVLRRVVDNQYYDVSSYGWKYNSAGEIVVRVGFAGSPPATQDITVVVMIHFG